MKYCFKCGTKLTSKFIELDGEIPFCDKCNELRFPIFSIAMSSIIVCKRTNKVLLIKQYNKDFNVLVAGYVTKGESLEETVKREIKEEVGLEVEYLEYLSSKYHEKSNTLMCNFYVEVDSEKVLDNYEIDSYQWYTFAEALTSFKSGTLAEEFYINFYNKKIKKLA